MFTNHVYGIDLGSNMIKIYSQKSDEILKERNMIAIRNKEDILAVGDDAYEMYEKNPANITVSSPMSNGMIANIGHLEILLHNLLEKTSRNSGSHPVIYFAVPVDMTEIEKRAYYSVAQSGRFRKSKVLLVETCGRCFRTGNSYHQDSWFDDRQYRRRNYRDFCYRRFPCDHQQDHPFRRGSF